MAVYRPVSTGDPDYDDADGTDRDSTPSSPLVRRSFQNSSASQPQPAQEAIMDSSGAVTARVAYTLYLCHSLSTWQSRVYEFAAVLFTVSSFPENLLASSILGMAMNLSVLCFASLLGTWVDRAPSRLSTLCLTIVANRVSVVAACLCWLLIVGSTVNGEAVKGDPTQPPDVFWLAMKKTTFFFIVVFGVIERLSRTANLLSIERDWVPTMAHSTRTTEKFSLAQLNAVMSRIDLVCKLFAPIAISSFVAAVGSMRIVVGTLLILNIVTFAPEITTAKTVWNSSSRLSAPKETDSRQASSSAVAAIWANNPLNDGLPFWKRFATRVYWTLRAGILCVKIWFQDYKDNLRIYFTYHVWIPSMALSVLHFSVLNYSATLTVYLLSSGFSINIITMARAFSSIWEIGSTFFYPWGVRLCGAIYDKSSQPVYEGVVQEDSSDELFEEESRRDGEVEEQKVVAKSKMDKGVAALGLFGLGQMWLCLVPAAFAIWTLSTPRDSSSPPPTHSTFITVVLLTTIPFSRFGRWTNHLNTQQLTQTLVPSSHRSGFAGAEMALVNLFQMGHWMVTAIWSTHEDFKWLAAGSVASVAVSWFMYLLWWSRARRST